MKFPLFGSIIIVMNEREYIGDCRNEGLVDDIFGSVSEFARVIEELGNEFSGYRGTVVVTYDEDTDIHSFWLDE